MSTVWKKVFTLPAGKRLLLMPLIGRTQEIDAVCSFLLQPEVRLLTLTGPGGVGKTRLALQVAAELADQFDNGVGFVSLASIGQSRMVLPTIAQSLGLAEESSSNTPTLIQMALKEKSCLLLLDNFEHVTEAAPALKELLLMCPQLKILVTSRTVLALVEEQEFYVPPLALPDLAQPLPCAELAQVAAVTLFVQRVRSVLSDFELTEEIAAILAQICVRLDGLPLAIELAAARMKLFSPQSLLTQLDHRLTLLTQGASDAPERQQTLRKTIEWSYDLLTPAEKCLFRRLSVFVGGCTLPAIEALSQDILRDSGQSIFDMVTSLLNKSLLQRKPINNHEQRFILLETLREYALECLRTGDEEETTRQMHAEYYLSLVQSFAAEVMESGSPLDITCIESDFENILATFNWFLHVHDGQRVLELSRALGGFWIQFVPGEGYRWSMQALESARQSKTPVQIETRALILNNAALIEYCRSNWTEADRLVQEAQRLLKSSGSPANIARLLLTEGAGALIQGQYDITAKIARKSLQMLQDTAAPQLTAEAHLLLAYSAYFQGNSRLAHEIEKKGLELTQKTGDLSAMIRAAHACALFADAQGKTAEVEEICKLVIATARARMKIGGTFSVATCLIGLGAIAGLNKRYTEAVRLWGKAKNLSRRRDGLSELEPEKWLEIILNTNLLYARIGEALVVQVGKPAFEAAWQEGQGMTVEELLSSVLQMNVLPASAAVLHLYLDALTPREKEILLLLARGMSSASVAKELMISLATVNTHVRAIYSKLGISSRSAATRYVLEHHLA
ncbi:MAG TPA: LuxR C-terminal-related transcriptional regulator [Ktedonobacteraceae bacterium]|jgi:predicted ATPase/DNA-binding CsgD family transcriptional regulator